MAANEKIIYLVRHGEVEEKLRKRSEKPDPKDDTAGTPAAPVTTA